MGGLYIDKVEYEPDQRELDQPIRSHVQPMRVPQMAAVTAVAGAGLQPLTNDP